MIFLGIDVGSSSVKTSLVDGESGKCLGAAFYPEKEMDIVAVKPGWAEQDPQMWWENFKGALKKTLIQTGIKGTDISAIGISYQMHGLVCIDKYGSLLRPSIIWCDSRAVSIGNKAFSKIGEKKCLSHLLNNPGNFTASKLAWVKEFEPDVYAKVDKIMLPGDYLNFRLTGEKNTTISGLSEGIFWDFVKNEVSQDVLSYFGFNKEMIPEIVPTFSVQGRVTSAMADDLGLKTGIPVSYRAGDQPNNALSLNVFNPGEIAATAGTSGVVYGVSGDVKYDPFSRVNTFAHVNHTQQQNRLGVLLCVNGTGILNSWLHKNVSNGVYSYKEMDRMAYITSPGAKGLLIHPFGNGAERLLQNKESGASISGLNFNIHTQADLFRAAQEGIVYAFNYGMEVMKETGIEPQVIRAGKANMFMSELFREALSCVSGAKIELYDTDGAQGAARGAAFGTGYYNSLNEAFSALSVVGFNEPDNAKISSYKEAYENWKLKLKNI